MCNKVDDLKEAYDKLVEVQKEAKLCADETYIEQDEYINLLMNKKAIQHVRELHKEIDGNTSICGDPDCCGEYEEGYIVCGHCYDDYPCMTIQALDGEQNE